MEFGTSLYDLVFVILDDVLDDDTDVDNNACTASSTYNCKLDFNIKLGVRISMTHTIHVNVYRYRMRVGNLHNDDTGKYDVTAAGIGYRF